jgi:hypothetical protein
LHQLIFGFTLFFEQRTIKPIIGTIFIDEVLVGSSKSTILFGLNFTTSITRGRFGRRLGVLLAIKKLEGRRCPVSF